MSNGSIMELVAKGKLDEDIIDMKNDTSIFNYKISKKNKYTKGDEIFYPKGNTGWGNTFRVYIDRKGDLLYGLYLIIKLPKLSINNLNTLIPQDELDTTSKYRVKYSDFIGNVIVEKISLYINGQLIDEQQGDYMQFYTDLYVSDSNRKLMIGLDDILNKPNVKINSEYIYVPLKFWFCNEFSKPLPLIALQNSEIYVDIKFRNFSECVSVLEMDNNNQLYYSNIIHKEVPIEDVFLQANFYYLDLEERKKMALEEYEILITQSQVRSMNFLNNANLLIDFNHIIKDIFFLIQPNNNKQYGDYFNFSTKMDYPTPNLNPLSTNSYKLFTLEAERHLLSKARILFNGIERVGWRDAKYYYYMQNHENYCSSLYTYIYMYSFNAKPTSYNNNSGCNFSRLDNAYLQVEINHDKINLGEGITTTTANNYELKCYATNFNILIIKNGLAGLKYNN